MSHDPKQPETAATETEYSVSSEPREEERQLSVDDVEAEGAEEVKGGAIYIVGACGWGPRRP